ncbi:hypothetical protein NITLEN_10176 [Nitrospira lenta]|uniref:Uncharacterized protein n=1 Tax=Nitrospira lenta TaxID=1436998 RepID=A0A330L034_9BACT|nr:hypothetical protein NITLEN_10176 [Nitrospira lenta]
MPVQYLHLIASLGVGRAHVRNPSVPRSPTACEEFQQALCREVAPEVSDELEGIVGQPGWQSARYLHAD